MSPSVVQAVVDCGALEGLVTCLEEFDPGVKEAACYTLGYVAGHSPELAQQVEPASPPLAIPMLSCRLCLTAAHLTTCITDLHDVAGSTFETTSTA